MHEARHKCGVGAVLDLQGQRNVIPCSLKLLRLLRHRGQLGPGIGYIDEARGRMLQVLKGNGTIDDVLTSRLTDVHASAVILHNRYATCGSLESDLAHPVQCGDDAVLAFNGNLANFDSHLKALLNSWGVTLERDVDTEALAQIIARVRSTRGCMHEAFREMQQHIDGCCNAVVLTRAGDVYAYRDVHGFRPLTSAVVDGFAVVASEDHAIKDVWPYAQRHIRDIRPGELFHAKQGCQDVSYKQLFEPRPKHCFFEWTYFADYLSTIDGVSVQQARHLWGIALAKNDSGLLQAAQRPDRLVYVPESAKAAADGYEQASGLPMYPVIRRLKEGRTFIQDGQSRERAVAEKYGIDRSLVQDMSIVLVDDSLVRGNTMKELVKSLRAAGTRNIHLRLACPPIIAPCFYGIDFATTRELLVSKYCLQGLRSGVLPDAVLRAIAQDLGVDSMAFLPVEAVAEGLGIPFEELCTACVTGDYPTVIGRERYALELKALYSAA